MTAPTTRAGGVNARDLRAKDGHDPALGPVAVPASPALPIPRVIGVDLSLTATGMSDGTKTWLVKSVGHKADSLSDRGERLRGLSVAIVGNCTRASLVVIEQPAFSRQMGHMHDRSGLWWLVVDALTYELHVPVAEVSPTGLKTYATGKGNAKKGAVIDATARRFPDIVTGADDNRCDSLWLAAMGLDHLGHPPVQLPQTHRRALDGVRWPAMAGAA
jgi:crossover junction endodeoxyribonuclease RuvC